MNIDEIFTQAKDAMLKDGEHYPVMFAELALGGVMMLAFADFPYKTTMEKKIALFRLARRVAKEHQGGELRQLCFICEAWFSQGSLGELSRCTPSQDPNRREALIAATISVDSGKITENSMHSAEIIRNGGIVDLCPAKRFDAKFNKLPEAFYAGWLSAKITDDRLQELIIEVVRGKR